MKSALSTLAALILWAVGAAAIVVAVVALLGFVFNYSTSGLFAGLVILPLALALWAGLIINLHRLIND